MYGFDAALQSSGLLYGLNRNALVQALSALGSDLRGWWTTYDDSLNPNPGLTLSAGNVQSWTDQVNGHVVSAPSAGQRALFTTDGSHFFARPVVQCVAASSRFLRGNPLASNLFVTDEYSWFLIVYRVRVDPLTVDGGIVSGQAVGTLHHLCHWENSDRRARAFVRGVTLDAGVETIGTGLVIASIAHDPGGTRIRMFPGVQYQSATAGPLLGNIDRLTVGAQNTAGATPSDVSIAEIIAINGWTAEREAALVAALQAKWDTGQQRPPLPSTAVEYWHSELDCSPSSWKGQIGGRVLSGLNTPTVATDGAHFRGRVVAKSTAATNSAWVGIGLAPLAGSGTLPWIFNVFRKRNTMGNQIIYRILAPEGGSSTVLNLQTDASGNWQALLKGTVTTTPWADGPSDQTVHAAKVWPDGANGNLTIDTVNTQIAWPGVTVDPVTTAIIGAASITGSFGSDANHAFLLVCASKPTTQEIAALNAWAQQYWGAL